MCDSDLREAGMEPFNEESKPVKKKKSKEVEAPEVSEDTEE